MTYSDKIRAEWEKENGTALEWAADWFLSKHTEYVNKLREEIEKKRDKLEDTGGMTGHYIAGQKKALDEILELTKE